MKAAGWIVLVLGLLALSLLLVLASPGRGEVAGVDSEAKVVKGGAVAASDLAGSQPARFAVSGDDGARCAFEVELSSTVPLSIPAVSFDLVVDERSEALRSEIRGTRVALEASRLVARCDLLVRSPGFCDNRVELNECPETVVHVVMVPETALAGRVDRVDGTPIRTFTLLAWPTGQHFDPQAFDAQRPERSPRGVLVCRCEPDGSFAFRGAQAGTLYRIYGGGDGWILAERWSPSVVPPRRDWSLKAEPVFAALAEFRDADGTSVSIAPERGVVAQFGSSDHQVQPVAGSRAIEAVLAGLSPKFLDVQAHQSLALVTGPVILGSTAPWRLELEVPGYADFSREFVATRLDLPPATIDCRLTRTAEGFGAIEVQLVGGALLKPEDRWPAGVIRLISTDGTAYTMRHPALTATARLDGVPWGTYGVTFRSELCGAQFPPPDSAALEVRVGAEPARVEIRIETTAILDLNVVDQSGAEYRGPLEIRLMRSTDDGTSGGPITGTGMFPVSIDGPPDSISLASGGAWTLGFGWPGPDKAVHPSAYESIQVEAGAHTRHTIAVRSP